MTETINACASYPVSIFIGGEFELRLAKMVCRDFCDREKEKFGRGLCVTVTPTTYIYTGGEAEGIVVGLINYPRFPLEPGQLQATANALAEDLRLKLGQTSFTTQTPDVTYWSSLRDSDGNPKGGNEVPSRSDDSAGRETASPETPAQDTNTMEGSDDNG